MGKDMLIRKIVGHAVEGKLYPRLNLPSEFADIIGKSFIVEKQVDGSILLKPVKG
jgi:hypothetical protein